MLCLAGLPTMQPQGHTETTLVLRPSIDDHMPLRVYLQVDGTVEMLAQEEDSGNGET